MLFGLSTRLCKFSYSWYHDQSKEMGLTVIISGDIFGEQLEGLTGADYSEKLRVARELINTLYMHSIPPPVSKKFKPRPDSASDDRSRKVC